MKELSFSRFPLLVSSALLVSTALAACTQTQPAPDDESLGGASSGGSSSGGNGLGGEATGGEATGGEASGGGGASGGTDNLGGSGTGGDENEPDPVCVEAPAELGIWWNETPFEPEDPGWNESWLGREKDVIASRAASIGGESGWSKGAGPVGWALSFQGELVLVDLGTSPIPFQSVEFWIKTTDTDGQLINVPWNFLVTLEAGKIKAWFRDGEEEDGTGPEADKSYRLDSPSVNDGKNHHIATTLDAENDSFKLYVDGELVDSVALDPELPEFFFFSEIGGGQIGGNSGTFEFPKYYAGLLDEPSFYGGTITASEVKGIFNAGSAGKCLPD